MTSDSASRVTRSRRNLQLAVLLFACCLTVVTALRAQEPGKATTETAEGTEVKDAGAKVAPPKDARSGAPSDAKTPRSAPEEPASEPNRKPGVVGATPGHFEPSEKVRADFDVSFPVDI